MLGGVCGGLAARGPLAPAHWRALFILLAPLTLGAAALLYLALWYGMPLAAPAPTVATLQSPVRPLRRWGLLALTLAALLGLIALWQTGRLAAADAALAALALGGAFYCLSVWRPRGARMIPLLACILPLLLLLWQSGALPAGMADTLARAAPAPILLLALRALVRGERTGARRALLANLLALGGMAVFVAGVAALAITREDGRLRDAGAGRLIQRALPAELRLLRLELSALASEIIVERALSPLPELSGRYHGGANFRLTLVCNGAPCPADGRLPAHEDGTADLHIHELQQQAFPPLSARGRGQLRLRLPATAPLDLLIRSRAGPMTLSLSGLQLERLNVELGRGDALVSLPEYAPLATARGDTQGRITLAAGDLTLRLPPGLDGRFPLLDARSLDYPTEHYARQHYARQYYSSENETRSEEALVALQMGEAGGWSQLELSAAAGEIRLRLAGSGAGE